MNEEQKAESREQKFAVGERVTWTHVTSSVDGNRIRYQTREGIISEISANGVSAKVKSRNGRTRWVLLQNLTKHGEETALTKAFRMNARSEVKA